LLRFNFNPNFNLVLIGMRCTGKSAVGKAAAKALDWPFVDTDKCIVERAGRDVATIFAQDGETAFRALEAEIVAEAAESRGKVIATGGGVVLSAANTRALRETGILVHLTADPSTIHKRILADLDRASQRPALTEAADGLDEVRQVWAARRALYESARDTAISGENRPIQAVLDDVLAAAESLAADRFP
jgi:shikimate kinase